MLPRLASRSYNPKTFIYISQLNNIYLSDIFTSAENQKQHSINHTHQVFKETRD